MKIIRFDACLLILLTIFCNFIIFNCSDINPYQILGIPRNADERQIKEAYRKKAKDWHPDRNKSPEAHEKFMQINKAYEILSDTERRSLYDDYGTTNEPRQGGFQRESHENFFRDFDPFEGFFGGQGFGFNQKRQSRKNPEEEINKRIYEDTILPNSHIKPYLIYTYTEFCFSCIAVENIWEILKQEVKNIGFGAGHSDASWNRELSRLLEIRTVPSIVAIINGRVHHFRGEFHLKDLREFLRNLLPSRLITSLNKNNFNTTLQNTLNDNKVFSLFITSSSQISLRYQVPCFQMINNIKCGSIKLNSVDQEFLNYLTSNFKVPYDLNTKEMLIMFKEKISSQSDDKNVHRPFFIQASSELAYNIISQTFENNKYLVIPRISSATRFVDLCPSWFEPDSETPGPKRIICSILVANSETKIPNILFDNVLKHDLLQKIQTDSFFKNSNIQFTYIYSNVQNNFVEKLLKNTKTKTDDSNYFDSKIVILKRLNERYALFEIIDDIPLNDLNFLEILKMKLLKFQNNGRELKFKMTIPNFYQETNQDFLNMIIDYLETIWDYLTDRSFWERILGNSTYMMVIFCTFLFIWLMMMFSAEKSNPNSSSKSNRNKNFNQTPNKTRTSNSRNQSFNESFNQSHSKPFDNDSSRNNTTFDDDLYNSRFDDFNKNTSNQFEVVEMKTKTFSALITNLPKGFRTILLIVNNENKNQLIHLFNKVCNKFSNKSYRLRFGFLNQNTFSGEKWLNEIVFDKYKQLGEDRSNSLESNGDSDDEYEQIGDKNLIDLKADCNVLAINSAEKYYIPLNLRLNDLNESPSSYLNLRRDSNKSIMEQSIGFEESYSLQMENKFMNEVSNWLEKFTEGLLSNKKYIKEWPVMN